ncbi:hypothetical protein WJ32_08530 [Burkholderia ubonensis]|uniref:Uncharacterized protein n=1 Tax=Burkholderia ubonensis TaxID=101571 RepID=A0A103QVQ6_9BURK|nr:hypothetical protein [Burkholderia ubonensis]AOJ62499.1 hypothetical protein WJ32_08530 [Burkholderia ubonensis]KVG56462.1 hypothetical protein WJ33_37195 [Burkholderia ubonensis]
MSDSTTPLNTISSTQANKEATANGLFDAASPSTLWGRHDSATSGLTWGYYGGRFVDNTGTAHAISNGTITLTASATNYIYADKTTGAVSANTTGFPAGQVPLYSVVTNASTATSYLDYRSYQPSATGGGAGTVTSVGLSMPTQFSVANSPVTSSGTLAVTWANASANQVLAGPASGAAAAPTIRALVGADIPPFTGSGASHTTGGVPDPGSTAGSTRFLREDSTWAVPPGSGGGGGTVTSIGGTGGVETDQASGAAITSSGSVRANRLPNVVTSAHTFVTGDRGAAIITNSSSAVTQTLPAATGSSGNFPNGWFCDLTSIGTGTTTVAVPSGAQLDGVTNGTATLGQFSGLIAYTDGTNWFTKRGGGSAASHTTPSIVQQAANGSNTTSLTITLGSTPTAGNLVIAVLGGYANNSGTPIANLFTPPDQSWTQIGQAASGNNEVIAMFMRTVQSGDGTGYSWTAAGTGFLGRMYEIANAGEVRVTGNNFQPAPATSSGTSYSPGGSAPTSTCLAISGIEQDTATATASLSSGWTQDQGGSASGLSYHQLVLGHRTLTAGPFNGFLATWSGASTSQVVPGLTACIAPQL